MELHAHGYKNNPYHQILALKPPQTEAYKKHEKTRYSGIKPQSSTYVQNAVLGSIFCLGHLITYLLDILKQKNNPGTGSPSAVSSSVGGGQI